MYTFQVFHLKETRNNPESSTSSTWTCTLNNILHCKEEILKEMAQSRTGKEKANDAPKNIFLSHKVCTYSKYDTSKAHRITNHQIWDNENIKINCDILRLADFD